MKKNKRSVSLILFLIISLFLIYFARKNTSDNESFIINNDDDVYHCADEGQNCECNGTVFYGKRHKDQRRPGRGERQTFGNMLKSKWGWWGKRFAVAKSEGNLKCESNSFKNDRPWGWWKLNGDPLRGHYKSCWCVGNKSDGNKSLILKNIEEDKLLKKCQANSRELGEQKEDLQSKLWDARQLKNELENIKAEKELKIKTLKNRQNELMEQIQDCKSNERQTDKPTNYYREPTLNSNNVKLPSYSLYFRPHSNNYRKHWQDGWIELENKTWNDSNEFLPLDLGLSNDTNKNMQFKMAKKSFTIEFWVKPEQLFRESDRGGNQVIRKGTEGYGVELVSNSYNQLQGTKGTIKFLGAVKKYASNYYPEIEIKSKENVVELNKWQHIAVSCYILKTETIGRRDTHDTIVVKFFVNGEMVGSPEVREGHVVAGTAKGGYEYPHIYPLVIGKGFVGNLADLRLWRTEISPNDIRKYWKNTNLTSHPKLSTLLLNLINNPDDEPNSSRCIKNGKHGVFNRTVVYQPKCIGRNKRISNSLVNTGMEIAEGVKLSN